VPETLDPPAIPYVIGSQRQFWLSNSDDGVYSQITATLEYLTPHAYFFVENGVPFNQQEAEALLDTFEEKIYPTDRAFFGSEWTPGVDNDPHLYIIYARDLGASVAGFYVSIDEYNPLVVEHSNGIEAFYIDSSQDLGDEYTYSTLAHEFQHMIHWYQDANESSFLDEGFAELASFLNGYNVGGADWIYTSTPDLALTDWEESGSNYAHYGANFLFVTYFLDRFREEATQALIHNPDNELDSVDSTLEQLGMTDPLTHQPITADDFFLDWVIANYVHDESVADGRYYYHIYPNAPTTSDTEIISTCPQEPATRTVNQYGVDYIRVTCSGDYTIYFSGATLTPLLSADPHSGDYAFWSNKANESNTSLMRAFDLSAVSGPVTLEYWTWFDLEANYDYVYLEASTDGENWEILIPPPARPTTPPAALTAGVTPENPAAGYRNRLTSPSTPVRPSGCASITSPTRQSSSRGSCWTTSPSRRLTTSKISNSAMAAGRRLALSASRTPCRKLSAWRSSGIPAMRRQWKSSPSAPTSAQKLPSAMKSETMWSSS